MSEYNWTAGYPSRIPEKMPPKEFEMGKFHIVDLTKVLDPKTESRRCRLWRFNTGGSIPDFHTIMDLTSHLGTHCECPYHHDDNWASVAELPLTNFMGRGIYAVLDLPANHQITGADLEAAIGSRIRPGDTVILDSPHIALVLGAGLGLLAGYSGGFVSGLIMRMVDAQLSIPGLILTMCLVAIFGGSILSVSVVFPLMKPIICTAAVLATLSTWNDFQVSVVFLQNDTVKNLAVTQYYFFGKNTADLNYAFAVFLLSMVPILTLYFVFQKHIVSGITAGAVKG